MPKLTHSSLVWAKIKPDILQLMKSTRDNRLRLEFLSDVLPKRRRTAIGVLRVFQQPRLSQNLLMPGPPDFWELDPVKDILNAPAEAEITECSFDVVVSQLPKSVDDWRNKVDQALAQVIKYWDATKYNDEPPEEVYHDFGEVGFYLPKKDLPNIRLSQDQLMHKLRLASTVFKYNICQPNLFPYAWDMCDSSEDEYPLIQGPPLFYPHVSGHSCLTLSGIQSFDMDPTVEAILPRRKRWSCDNLLDFDFERHVSAKNIIETVGLDPSGVTAKDIDDLDPRLACRICSQSVGRTTDGTSNEKDYSDKDSLFPLFDWRAAVRIFCPTLDFCMIQFIYL